MKVKHTKAVDSILSSYFGCRKVDMYSGVRFEIFEEEFDFIQHKIFLYFKRHKTSFQEIGRGRFGSTNNELYLLSGTYINKRGFYFKYE